MMDTSMSSPTPPTDEQINELVIEHKGWAESIARSVARSWNMDWQMDGLDGAAMEALFFCARRFDPSRGIPFRGYARKRIHEASTEQARKSKGWRKSSDNKEEVRSREVSADLYNVFPELREGYLPGESDSGGGDDDVRSAIRQLLVGASLIATRYSMEDGPTPDQLIDYRKVVTFMANLEPVHQLLLYKVYWDGISLRSLADEWETDDLNVTREHKSLIGYLHKSFARGKPAPKLKVRPGLASTAHRLKKEGSQGPFSDVLKMKT